MKFMYYVFVGIWVAVPLILIPLWAYHLNDRYFLIGISVWYLGVFLAKIGNKLILALTVPFIVYWIVKGFHLSDYWIFFYLSLLSGYILFAIGRGYNSEIENT
jgi:uncharacterized membrane protein YqaE (UPF0057 family)